MKSLAKIVDVTGRCATTAKPSEAEMDRNNAEPLSTTHGENPSEHNPPIGNSPMPE